MKDLRSLISLCSKLKEKKKRNGEKNNLKRRPRKIPLLPLITLPRPQVTKKRMLKIFPRLSVITITRRAILLLIISKKKKTECNFCKLYVGNW